MLSNVSLDAVHQQLDLLTWGGGGKKRKERERKAGWKETKIRGMGGGGSEERKREGGRVEKDKNKREMGGRGEGGGDKERKSNRGGETEQKKKDKDLTYNTEQEIRRHTKTHSCLLDMLCFDICLSYIFLSIVPSHTRR